MLFRATPILAFLLVLAPMSASGFSPEPWEKKGPHSLRDALKHISITPIGKKVSDSLAPKINAGLLRVESSHGEVAKKIIRKVGVAGVYFQSTIFVDDTLPYLALVTTLFHEMVHASDYLNAKDGASRSAAVEATQNYFLKMQDKMDAGDKLSAEELEEFGKLKAVSLPYVVKGEHLAYSQQNAFLSQLIDSEVHFEEVIEKLVLGEFILGFPLRQQDFRTLLVHRNGFGLERDWVDAYLAAHPFPSRE